MMGLRAHGSYKSGPAHFGAIRNRGDDAEHQISRNKPGGNPLRPSITAAFLSDDTNASALKKDEERESLLCVSLRLCGKKDFGLYVQYC